MKLNFQSFHRKFYKVHSIALQLSRKAACYTCKGIEGQLGRIKLFFRNYYGAHLSKSLRGLFFEAKMPTSDVYSTLLSIKLKAKKSCTTHLKVLVRGINASSL